MMTEKEAWEEIAGAIRQCRDSNGKYYVVGCYGDNEGLCECVTSIFRKGWIYPETYCAMNAVIQKARPAVTYSGYFWLMDAEGHAARLALIEQRLEELENAHDAGRTEPTAPVEEGR